ncbi:hypothetical protein GCM10010399_63930 [Dactylosporangium fulvum]|uniref:Uncharacterized protein n=1 Tax=Dactylosporangium fulvum TaxID=53359 RepID=A0ABY5W9U0_9ACTN|nr:hypothetical protein [Dactylosporangium fulvum]UWP85784.1 hypothetical protein Dfulv_16690 [Dactylosporangium fulvum]
MTTDELRAEALAGPWQAVLADRYGYAYQDVTDARKNIADPDDEVRITIVRGTALPNNRSGDELRLPGSYQSGDQIFEIDAYLEDEDPSIGAEVRFEQAKAMAAGLNAAAGAR